MQPCPPQAPVKYRRNSKAVHATSGCTTPSPTLPPSTAPFVPYGVGQRCLQAGRLAPWTRRQLGGNTGRSLLETINSPEQCFSYCGIYGGTPAPYYFNWKTTTNQCFCCGGECTLVFDPDYTAYVAQTTATAAPTPFFNTTGSRRRLMAEDANVVMLEAKGKDGRGGVDVRPLVVGQGQGTGKVASLTPTYVGSNIPLQSKLATPPTSGSGVGSFPSISRTRPAPRRSHRVKFVTSGRRSPTIARLRSSPF